MLSEFFNPITDLLTSAMISNDYIFWIDFFFNRTLQRYLHKLKNETASEAGNAAAMVVPVDHSKGFAGAAV